MKICIYKTNALKTLTPKTRNAHSVNVEKTSPLEVENHSGDAKATGTPITSKNETAIKARTDT